jgi:heme/copper-type cytochrome/quinol oxidase subunit 2
MKKIIKGLMVLAIAACVILPTARALAVTPDVGINLISSQIQLSAQDPRVLTARIINTAMLFLGIIAVVIVLLGGFQWMTAAGNEDKVSGAKKLMGAGVIGLVIILAAWGIASFVLNSLINATQ